MAVRTLVFSRTHSTLHPKQSILALFLGSQVPTGAGRGGDGHRVETELCCAGMWSRWDVWGRGLRLRPHLPQQRRRRDRQTDRQTYRRDGQRDDRTVEHRKGDSDKDENDRQREKQHLECGLANDLGSCRLRALRRTQARL